MAQFLSARDIQNRGPQILGVSISLVAISGIFVGARVLARRFYTAGKTTSWDDWLIVVAWFFSLARSIVESLSVMSYGYGKHSADLSAGDAHQAALLVWMSGLLYRFATLIVKVSILMLYLRLFTLKVFNPRFRLLVLSTIYATVLTFGSFILVGIFGCWPVNRYWNRSKEGRCIDFLPFYYMHTGLEVLFDLWIMLLPVGIIRGLKLPMKTKWRLVVVFALGLLSTAANIPVFQALSEASQHADMSWTTTGSSTWATIELNLAIICTCLPILRNPLRTIYNRTFGTTANNSGNAKIGSSHHRLDPWEGGSNGTTNTIMMGEQQIAAVGSG